MTDNRVTDLPLLPKKTAVEEEALKVQNTSDVPLTESAVLPVKTTAKDEPVQVVSLVKRPLPSDISAKKKLKVVYPC